MPRLAPIALLLLLVAFAATGSPATAAPAVTAAGACRDQTLVPNRANASRIRAATLCLLNIERRSNGLSRLTAQGELRSAAQRYSRLMVARHFFDHVGPDGSTLRSRVGRTPYLRRARAWWLGENLGWGAGLRGTPLSTVRAWMASPGHRAQILTRRYRDIGIGIVSGTPRATGIAGATYSTVFGSRVRT